MAYDINLDEIRDQLVPEEFRHLFKFTGLIMRTQSRGFGPASPRDVLEVRIDFNGEQKHQVCLGLHSLHGGSWGTPFTLKEDLVFTFTQLDHILEILRMSLDEVNENLNLDPETTYTDLEQAHSAAVGYRFRNG